MSHEDLHQRSSMKIGQARNLANHSHVPETLDRFAVLAVLVPNQHHAMHRQLRRVQRCQRKQRVIHGANAAARSQDPRLATI